MYIEIGDIIKSRTGVSLPAWLVAILKRIIHQREINQIIASGRHLAPQQFLAHALQSLDIGCAIVGGKEIAPSGRYIFVANHPLGGADGMLITRALLERYGDAGAVVNDMLMEIEPLKSLWIPINKYGRQNSLHHNAYHTALSSPSKQILTFPAGLCSRISGGKITDTKWSSRFIKDAQRYDRAIVPTFVEGELSRRFYNIYRIRRGLKIGLNIELLLLVDEMFRQRGKSFRIVFGTPIKANDIPGSNLMERCDRVREMVYELKNNGII